MDISGKKDGGGAMPTLEGEKCIACKVWQRVPIHIVRPHCTPVEVGFFVLAGQMSCFDALLSKGFHGYCSLFLPEKSPPLIDFNPRLWAPQ